METMETLSEEGLTVLMTAVRVAKDEQIRTVAALRARLNGLYPGEEGKVQEALVAWGGYERAKREVMV